MAKTQNKRTYNFALTGDQNLDLPSGVRVGQEISINNSTANSSILTIRASDTSTVETIRLGSCQLVALQDNPTTSTHWRVIQVQEEGSWTPTVIMGTAQGTAAVTPAYAYFQRNNKTVQIRSRLTFVKGTGTGTVRIGGLPYTIENNSTYFAQFPLLPASAGDLALTAGNVANAWGRFNTTQIELYQTDLDAGGSTELIDTNFDASASILVNLDYRKI